MDGVTEGRIVHYVLNVGNNIGAHRAAMIVNSWPDLPVYQKEGRVNLHVFPDFGNDGDMYNSGISWATSTPYDEVTKAPGTWHWIERVEPAKTSVTTEQIRAVFDQKALARQAYYAYGSVTDFKNFQGNPMPEWEALPEKIQQAWMAAARFAWNEGYQAATLPKSE